MVGISYSWNQFYLKFTKGNVNNSIPFMLGHRYEMAIPSQYQSEPTIQSVIAVPVCLREFIHSFI